MCDSPFLNSTSYYPKGYFSSSPDTRCKPAPKSASHLQILKGDTLHGTCNNPSHKSTLLSVACCNSCQTSSETSERLWIQHSEEYWRNTGSCPHTWLSVQWPLFPLLLLWAQFHYALHPVQPFPWKNPAFILVLIILIEQQYLPSEYNNTATACSFDHLPASCYRCVMIYDKLILL